MKALLSCQNQYMMKIGLSTNYTQPRRYRLNPWLLEFKKIILLIASFWTEMHACLNAALKGIRLLQQRYLYFSQPGTSWKYFNATEEVPYIPPF